MASVTVTVDGLKQLDVMQAFLSPATLEKARRDGIRYASKAVPTAASKAITIRYNIKAARVRNDIAGPYVRGDTATLVFDRRPPTLQQFGFRPGRRGGPQPGQGRGKGWGKPKPKGQPASASIFKGQRLSYPAVFLGRAQQGISLPLRRTTSGRLQVEYGPYIGYIFSGRSRYGPEIRAVVEQRIQEQFTKGIERSLKASARGFSSSR